MHFYKPPPKNWLAFDAIKTGIQHLTSGVGLTSPPARAYFIFASLLLIFIVSQFFCYVFYPKQNCNFVFFLLACRFKNSFHLLTFSLLFVLSQALPFFNWWFNFVCQKFTAIFMQIFIKKFCCDDDVATSCRNYRRSLYPIQRGYL